MNPSRILLMFASRLCPSNLLRCLLSTSHASLPLAIEEAHKGKKNSFENHYNQVFKSFKQQ